MAGATNGTWSACARGCSACGAMRARRSSPPASASRSRPGEGIFLWGRVPDATRVDELVRRARAHSILLARGSLFSCVQGCSQWLRFNVCHSDRPALIEFLRGALRAA